MKIPLEHEIVLAIRTLFLQNRKNRFWFAVLSLGFFALYQIIPVWLAPENSFDFLLTRLKPLDFVFYTVLSTSVSLLVLMQVFLFARTNKKRERATSIIGGSAGVFMVILSGLLATAACSTCVIAALVGFLGAGSIFFISSHRALVMIGAILLVLIALYFTAKSVNRNCGCVVAQK